MIDVRKMIRSFKYAWEGINYALNNDQNLVIHLVIGFAVIILAIILRLSFYEIGVLGVTILLVVASEMINSAIEKVVDLVTKEHRVEAKIAKDVSSGMVLISAIGSILIGLLIFIPHLEYFFR